MELRPKPGGENLTLNGCNSHKTINLNKFVFFALAVLNDLSLSLSP